MRAAPEQRLQRAVADYLAWALLPPAISTSHPAGGGGELRGKILKGTGNRAGWPDIEIIANDGRFYGIELKSARGVLSEAQRRTLPAINAAGAPTAVCRSLDDVQAALMAWRIATRDTKPSTERIRAGLLAPQEFPESDLIGRRRRRAQ
jgi:hypothetical protein